MARRIRDEERGGKAKLVIIGLKLIKIHVAAVYPTYKLKIAAT